MYGFISKWDGAKCKYLNQMHGGYGGIFDSHALLSISKTKLEITKMVAMKAGIAIWWVCEHEHEQVKKIDFFFNLLLTHGT